MNFIKNVEICTMALSNRNSPVAKVRNLQYRQYNPYTMAEISLLRIYSCLSSTWMSPNFLEAFNISQGRFLNPLGKVTWE